MTLPGGSLTPMLQEVVVGQARGNEAAERLQYFAEVMAADGDPIWSGTVDGESLALAVLAMRSFGIMPAAP
jgi:hypothetical protein